MWWQLAALLNTYVLLCSTSTTPCASKGQDGKALLVARSELKLLCKAPVVATLCRRPGSFRMQVRASKLEKPINTALHFAASNGHSGVLGLLLEAGADITLKDEEDYTALHLAALLLHPGCLRLLLADADAVETNHGLTSFHLAADSRNVEVFQLLLPCSNIDARDAEGSTPLHYASGDGRQTFVKLLLDARADKDATQNDGKTPLQLATEYGHQEVVSQLLAAGANSANLPVAPRPGNAGGSNQAEEFAATSTGAW